MTEPKGDEEEVKVGDVREGKGGLHVLMRVDAVSGAVASCTLLRSGRTKVVTVRTLRLNYRLVQRRAGGEE